MMKDAVISIHSLHNCGLEDEDVIDFTTDGFYYTDGEAYCVAYMESDVTGLEGTRTSVMVLPDRVVVDRDGGITSRMEFCEGGKTSFLYDTPMGSATLSMNTRRISCRFDEYGGEMELDYVLDMEHMVVSSNVFRLRVTGQRPTPERSGMASGVGC